jgi:small ligand-binding sensory domain FIST
VPTGSGSTVAIDNRPMPQGSLVGICFRANLQLQTVVAQGCRPIGPTFTVTEAEGSCILELDSKPAVSVLENLMQSLESVEEKTAVSAGLVCGIKAETSNDDDYLIRVIVGFVPSRNGIAVAGSVSTGAQFRFHVRDKKSALADLDLMVKRAQTERLFSGSRGKRVASFQISCVARGRNLFGDVNVDLTRTKPLVGEGAAVGGFYANGELGPVGIAGFGLPSKGGGTFLHGFTTVVAVLCDTSATSDGNIDGNIDSSSLSSEPVFDEPADSWG